MDDSTLLVTESHLGMSEKLLPADSRSDVAVRADFAHDGHAGSLLHRLQAEPGSCVLTFAGQGIPWYPELRELYTTSQPARALIERAAGMVMETVAERRFQRSGLYPRGFDLLLWLHDEASCPDVTTLASSVISQSMVFLTQVARYVSLYDEGLRDLFRRGSVAAVSGHSQGVMPALLVAEGVHGQVDTARCLQLVRYYLYQGLHMQQAWTRSEGGGTPMAAVSRVDLPVLQAMVTRLNAALPPGSQVVVSLRNTRNRNVVSGPVGALLRLRQQLEERGESERKAKAAGRFGGLPLKAEWEFLGVSAPFHSPYMEDGLRAMAQEVKRLGIVFDAARLRVPVLSPGSGKPLNSEEDLTQALLNFQFLEAVEWNETVKALVKVAQSSWVLDLGPGDAVAKLTTSCLRGTGTRVIALATASGRRQLLSSDAEIAPEVCYADFSPRILVLPDGTHHLDNSFTRFTGRPPILLPGMTPTTADVPIVAAAARAGFMAELAGGGQVTEKILRLRADELRSSLPQGEEVVFNALYLDPYLWGLHFREKGLVPRLRREGAPFCGVTISAGVPPLEEALSLLNELETAGLWLNAFKPGTVSQIEAVLQIAAAVPSRRLLIQIEGGKAGGHHSWEDLDSLLLETYHKIRCQPQLILCVGGGIATEERAASLLSGAWSERYGLPAMPVDAVFVGTLAMACAEACTSPAVKQALVSAKGTPAWVFSQQVGGDVTSGKSSLGADIYYLDNAASRVGRLLDEVAGDAAAVSHRREEIIAALGSTAKPYFGDVGSMTWSQVLSRMSELMATGRGGRYEDGVWPDRSYRERMADMIRRGEGRLSGVDVGEIPGLLTSLNELDDPRGVLLRFNEMYPDAEQVVLHPLDVDYFLTQVCPRAGKPVPFVPVIDVDVRRWYKSDSLWQSHDAQFSADQVLAIPGPEGVSGIHRVDEPVAEVLGRFERAMIERVLTSGLEVRSADDVMRPWPSRPLSPGLKLVSCAGSETLRAHNPRVMKNVRGNNGKSQKTNGNSVVSGERTWSTHQVRVQQAVTPAQLLSDVGGQFAGPLAAFLRADVVWEDGRRLPHPLAELVETSDGSVLDLGVQPDLQLFQVAQALSGGERVEVWLDGKTGGNHYLLKMKVMARLPGGERVLTFSITGEVRGGRWIFSREREQSRHEVAQFYRGVLFQTADEVASLVDPVTARGRFSEEDHRAYRAITYTPPGMELMPTAAFSLAWEAIFKVLTSAEIGGDLLRLVHLSNSFTPGPAWPIAPDEEVQITARVTRLENGESGRTLHVETQIYRDTDVAMTLHSAFFIRASGRHLPTQMIACTTVNERLKLEDEGSLQFLRDHPLMTVAEATPIRVGDTLDFRGECQEEWPRGGIARFSAHVGVWRASDLVGKLSLEGHSPARHHPVLALIQTLKGETTTGQHRPRKTLLTQQAWAPTDLKVYAEVGRDPNPIHVSGVIARMAGLPGPIVHGMWTSALCLGAIVRGVAGGEVRRIGPYSTEFLSPALPGEALRVEVVRVGVERGHLLVEATVFATRVRGEVTVARARARVAPPRTAYVFPGQGIQQPNMGMEGYQRSPAARRVWDSAEAFTTRELGFSLFHLVKENPKSIVIKGVTLHHPQGLLHLTQFTQVAMAVLAQAQVAELEEAGVLTDESVTCGHSVGEYNAIGALAGVLPLETVILMVYQRGNTMHRLVARDASGESGYRMGVIRPHVVGLGDHQTRDLVARISRETGLPVEIVNENIRGRQYSVTGRREALTLLADHLARLTPAGAKGAWIEVPGIDTPFHSTLLRAGVDDFRQSLEANFPPRIDPTRLVGRYVPNLVPRAFTLDRAYIEEVAAYIQSPVLGEVLAHFDLQKQDPGRLARTLLIELLSWQFASPVRWIETQELLFRPRSQGGLGVERVVEVGVGYQPTLANMARATLQDLGQSAEVWNAEAERVLVFDLEGDPQVSAPAKESSPVTRVVSPVPARPSATTTSPSPARVADRPLTIEHSLRVLLAHHARIRPEQVDLNQTLDQLFEGVSSRRNQVLMDLGAEFGVGAIDGAHEKPLTALITELGRRATNWQGPGAYTRAAQDEAVARVFGRAGVGRKEILGWLEGTWQLGPGLSGALLDTLALSTRSGASARGGVLGELSALSAPDKAHAQASLEKVVTVFASQHGLDLSRPVEGGPGVVQVDAAAVKALADDVLGPEGVLMDAARGLAARLGHSLNDVAAPAPVEPALHRLDLYEREHNLAYERAITPHFNPRRHVVFSSVKVWARRDVARLYYSALKSEVVEEIQRGEARRLASLDDEAVRQSARWFRSLAIKADRNDVAELLAMIITASPVPALDFAPCHPRLDLDQSGQPRPVEVPIQGPNPRVKFVSDMMLEGPSPLLKIGASGEFNRQFEDILTRGTGSAMDFRGRTALVTGAGPGSIAADIVRHLLRGGARVIVTTSTWGAQRTRFFRRLYQESASAGAELHLVPFNQASLQDVTSLVEWLFQVITEQRGASVRVVKEVMVPDLLIPFGAMGESATLDQVGPNSLITLRALLLSVERLIGLLATHMKALPATPRPCHVLLPFSPNHGDFGGDGLYAESKAALEVLLTRWRSEWSQWGQFTTLCGARIGWVRGTGLMKANDGVAAQLEEMTGVRTFSSAEMGFLLAALCSEGAVKFAQQNPVEAHLTGGFEAIVDLKGTVGEIRQRLHTRVMTRRRVEDLVRRQDELLGIQRENLPHVQALPNWSRSELRSSSPVNHRPAAPAPGVEALRQSVVIVGMGEVGPWGSSRTRFAVEVSAELNPAAVLELAWITGLVKYEPREKGGVWVDVASGDVVPEFQILSRYQDEVRRRSGIRFVEKEHTGFDPEALEVLTPVFVEQDLSFHVGSEAEARAFLARDAQFTRIAAEPGGERWKVTRLKGATIHVPRQVRLARKVAGQLPTGFDFFRYGIPADMVQNIDRISLFNLIATTEAFLSAGLSPEELLQWIHPTRVGNTQGAGIGGMRSLTRLYTDFILGKSRQGDVLQETLINVVAGYVVQSLVGSYGPMSHPVGACATAAVSLEEAVDKIRLGKADFVVAGGFDDIGLEGAVGFHDMSATADTDEMERMGLTPAELSRANDARRKGFVEAQGGGTLLLTRGDVATRLGLPVQGVVAYAGSFGDGVQKSVPAPGLGILACVAGGSSSPLGRALASYGLTADDVGLVYKHDTSTAANDPNENLLHDTIQKKLGRSPGNPLFVVSQKTLTGHSKGGAAAWQLIGLCQALEAGIVPGNRNLDEPDGSMGPYQSITFTDTPLEVGQLEAGVVTSLGFGHVGAIALVLHPRHFERLIPVESRAQYEEVRRGRTQEMRRHLFRLWMNQQQAFHKRTSRRFGGADGSPTQQQEEIQVLTELNHHLDLETGLYVEGQMPWPVGLGDDACVETN